MTKFFGEVGFGESIEEPADSGVWVDNITEVQYYGEVVRDTRQLAPGENLNGEITVSNSISIVSDDYANEHFFQMKYVRWEGVRWIVTNVEVRRPRLILSLGSIYNGPTT